MNTVGKLAIWRGPCTELLSPILEGPLRRTRSSLGEFARSRRDKGQISGDRARGRPSRCVWQNRTQPYPAFSMFKLLPPRRSCFNMSGVCSRAPHGSQIANNSGNDFEQRRCESATDANMTMFSQRWSGLYDSASSLESASASRAQAFRESFRSRMPSNHC